MMDFEIVPTLPTLFPSRGEAVPCGLVGSTIVGFGTLPDGTPHIEGGGLVIDYCPVGSQKTCRAIFEFNECGMWLVAKSEGVP